jgi:hypothetical protein
MILNNSRATTDKVASHLHITVPPMKSSTIEKTLTELYNVGSQATHTRAQEYMPRYLPAPFELL